MMLCFVSEGFLPPKTTGPSCLRQFVILLGLTNEVIVRAVVEGEDEEHLGRPDIGMHPRNT